MFTRNSDYYIEYIPTPPDFYDGVYDEDDEDKYESPYDDGEPYDSDIEEKY